MAHRVFLDTSSLMYRAFFSVPPSVLDERGRPINAVFGYLDMTSRFVSTYRPDEVVHVYDDDWKPAPRVRAYTGYKAHRPPDPEGLPEQFGVLREVLDALGLPQADAPNWEAEDAIGSLVARAGRRDRIDIVTGDRDLIQLVRDPQVRVLFTLRGVTDIRVLDEAGVFEKYGVPASRYADFAILRGDPSDGLPGVKGVGEKTARALVLAYPNLEALVEDAKWAKAADRPLQRSASLRAAVREAAGYLKAMHEVVPIRTDLEVRTWRNEQNEARLEELSATYRLGGPIGRLREALAGGRGVTAPRPAVVSRPGRRSRDPR
jgi:5'-3' exonuclease